MENIVDILDFLRLLVSETSDVPYDNVILADQGRDPPEGLYATYKLIPVRAYGHPRRDREEVPAVDSDIPGWMDYQERVITQMQFMLSCNFLTDESATAETARDAAWRLHNANFRNPIQELLYNNQAYWKDCSEVKDLTGLLQAGLQPRYHVDINMVLEVEVSDTVLKAAGFNFEIVDEDDNTIYDGVS